MKKVADKRR